jgi:predicted Zn-dependent protease
MGSNFDFAAGRVGAAALLFALVGVGCGRSAPPSQAPLKTAPVVPAAAPEFSSLDPSSEPQQPLPRGMSVVTGEIERAMKALATPAELAPYFIGQEVSDLDLVRVLASNGGITGSNRMRLRAMMTDVRIGKYELDSTHPIEDDEGEGGLGSSSVLPPDRPEADEALRHISWQEIDKVYRAASERFLSVQASGRVKVDIEDRSGDFSKEAPVQHVGPVAPPLEVSESDWQARLRALSARLRDRPGIHRGQASVEAFSRTRWLATSEGTKIQTGERIYRLSVSASTRAEDGMDLSRSEDFLASSAAGLPSQAALDEVADRIAADLGALQRAKLAEPFVGPAILSGRSAGVFFHETFGHRIEGERQKFEDEGQTFAKKLGERVMPPFLSVYDDPRFRSLGKTELSGFYRFDDEGVPAQRASLVEAGVLKGFLMSRVPVRGILRSNGHGRRLSGAATARQANLVVQPSEVVPTQRLRELLIAEVKRQNKPYGLMFSEIEGGYTQTERESTQGYKLLPVMVYRVYADGRPDELTRGVDIVGTPLVSLTKVLAADDQYAVFNGSCGAESGWVPVSAISPSLLVQQIEVALREKEHDKPPILAAPPNAPGGAP